MSTQPTPTTLSLRMPRGLWDDFAAIVYQQDRQFLLEVARDLGLPPREVLELCLGRLGPTTVPCVWTPPRSTAPDACPYWTCCGDGLWRRCPRTRLSETLPCAVHERSTGGCKLHTDPDLQAIPWAIPVRDGEDLLWTCPSDNGEMVLRNEEGITLEGRTVRQIRFRSELVWVRMATS